MIQTARRRRSDEASRFSVMWAACEPSMAAFHEAAGALHDRLLVAHPVRFGPVKSSAYPADSLEEKLTVAGAPLDDPKVQDLRAVLAAWPDWWLVISMVEVPDA